MMGRYDDNDDRKVEALATDCEVGDLTRAATPMVSAPWNLDRIHPLDYVTLVRLERTCIVSISIAFYCPLRAGDRRLPSGTPTATAHLKPSQTMGDASQQVAEAELEAFRQRWREEVQARNRQSAPHPQAQSSQSQPERREQRKTHHVAQPASVVAPGPSSSARRREAIDYSEEVEPRTYHDLPDKEEQLKLGTEGQDRDRRHTQEPKSALEHYERAVEKETQGHLGDSIQHYRRAFKVRPPTHPHMPSHSVGAVC